METGQVLNQTGGSTTEPSLEQKPLNTPEISSRTGQGTASKTGSGTGSRPAPEHISPSIPVSVENVFVDPLTPRPWNHQSSYLFYQILSDLNTGVQTISQLKNFYAFYAFLSNIEPKNVNKALTNSD